MKPVLHIVRGLPGSGKSTFAKSLGCFHIEADMFHISGGKYRYDRMKVGLAHVKCQLFAQELLRDGNDVVVSNTFTRLDLITPYLEAAKETGATVKIYKCAGNFGSIHDVPPEILAKMRLEWEPYRKEKVIK